MRRVLILDSFLMPAEEELAAAGEVIVCAEPSLRDAVALYQKLRARAGLRVLLARTCNEGWTHCQRRADADASLRVLGAESARANLKVLPPETRWIGMGSNTWKSDLDLGITYRRTTGRANDAGASLEIPWMTGIPGTIGGWVKMNAGAFGHSISELISRVKVDGVWLTAADCGFAYRHSAIQGEIQDVEFLPVPAGGESAESYRSRRRHFPCGTYGSFFKNPPGHEAAGALLERVGCKSLRVGGATVWSEHANVIVRGEQATGSDVLALAAEMQARVEDAFGIRLEPEVCGIILETAEQKGRVS